MKERSIKVVVWDLDETLWHGVLLEDGCVSLRHQALEIIRALDGRGILQSIASKNEYQLAMEKLRQFELEEYFLHPQINWNSKAASIERIAGAINIGLDSIAFIDDQPFERDEVRFSLPEVFCLDVADLDRVLDMPEMNPRFITEDARHRRLMYMSDLRRQQCEEEFRGTKEEFLSSLQMVFTISRAQEEDLQRAEELTLRTHQLNTTGYTYSYDELNYFRQTKEHQLLVAGLEDKYGSYGRIGLALVECRDDLWLIKLLLMSCRVMSRGVGMVMLKHLMRQAKKSGVRLQAEFVPNGRNRMMFITYKFAGFKEVGRDGETIILENDLTHAPEFPPYMQVLITT